MNLNLFPFLVSWSILAFVVLVMIAWRNIVARHEDHFIHVLGNAPVSQQARVAQRLNQIDKWGKALTVTGLAFGLLLAAAYMWQVWIQGFVIPSGL